MKKKGFGYMTIATKPEGFCLNCMKTKIAFKQQGTKYEMTKIPAKKLLKAGYKSYPVVMPNDKLNDKANWDGFNLQQIKKYAKNKE